MFQEVLLAWPSKSLQNMISSEDESILGRILQILRNSLSVGEITSVPELVTLIRQLLFLKSNNTKYKLLRVPVGSGWPGLDVWESYSFNVSEVAGQLLIEPKPWTPEWLGCHEESQFDVFDPEFSEVMVRQKAEVPMDPFLTEASGFDKYVCPGQREAVRSLLFMPAGETLIVNLPTGAGKSLVAQTPVLLRGIERGFTLFVVPTTALVLDLSRRMHELLLNRYPIENIPEKPGESYHPTEKPSVPHQPQNTLDFLVLLHHAEMATKHQQLLRER